MAQQGPGIDTPQGDVDGRATYLHTTTPQAFGSRHDVDGLVAVDAEAEDVLATSEPDEDVDKPPPSPGLTGKERYQKVEDINSGAHGVVILAADVVTDEEVAIKLLKRDQLDEYVERELEQHWKLHHPGIVEMREVFLTDSHLAIVMDYADGGNLASYVGRRRRLDEARAMWIFNQLIDALSYLHKQGMASRDIKLDNVLMVRNPQRADRPFIKLCDLGLAKTLDFHSVANTCVGTLDYVAPEVFMSDTSTGYNAQMADIWSCGVLLYVMLIGKYPFDKDEDAQSRYAVRPEEKQRRIMNAEVAPIPQELDLSADCRGLIDEILVLDPAHRISLQGMRDHPWLAECTSDHSGESTRSRWQAHGCRQSLEEVMEVFAHGKMLAGAGQYDYAIDDAIDDDLCTAALDDY